MIQALYIDGEGQFPLLWPTELERWQKGTGFLWIDLQGDVASEVADVGKQLDLHPAVLRALASPEHRAKFREFPQQSLLVLNAVGRGHSDKGEKTAFSRWRTLELNLVIGQRFLLTGHPMPVPAVATVWQRLTKEPANGSSLDFLFYHLCEAVTAGYHVVLDQLDMHIDQTEDQIFTGSPAPQVVDQLFALKRHIVYLRRVLGPQRDAFSALIRHNLSLLSPDNRTYLLEVYEHTLRVFDLLDTYRDLVSSSHDAYLSTVSNRMNEIMKTLTVVSTIMLPLTLISGIFGMNFVQMPLVQSPWGFGTTSLLMLLLGLIMAAYFRWRRML